MLNHVIIEREACVTTFWMCLAAATIWWDPSQSLQLQALLCSLLTEIMKKGLTTIFLPHAFRMRHLYYRTFFRSCQLALTSHECYFTNYLHFFKLTLCPAVKTPPEPRHSISALSCDSCSNPLRFWIYLLRRDSPAGMRQWLSSWGLPRRGTPCWPQNAGR